MVVMKTTPSVITAGTDPVLTAKLLHAAVESVDAVQKVSNSPAFVVAMLVLVGLLLWRDAIARRSQPGAVKVANKKKSRWKMIVDRFRRRRRRTRSRK